ncbi:MAG: type IX secretion system membrane protein PorP/SprF [Bacteroidota bacterium]|uniref:Type IX secretion system membrane protein PorP/SprF n=1 Tax=Flagellimonas profundi TaxID=2915620 RepID=A0ABS3FH10_9FLAO|nr:type IX secretion system membrane protein PorP/SprF [Allomuricauda profundi]MBO0342434.1 type IX secretion system membrane protein PorP/SprF [Allomuricauda profundi]MEC7770862.1 type IX secretion system membrane protein PorP/SprF [Bacteroidota bacterium]
MKSVIVFLLCMNLFFVKGQELTIPQLSQYLSDNPFLMSPSFAGIGNYVKVRMNGVTQWVGIQDAPDTQSLSADVRLGNRSGIGMVIYNDSNGETKQRGGKVSFAHHLTIDKYDEHYFSFALSFNLNQFRIDIENFDPNNDQAIINDRSSSNPNFDVGILYRKERFYLSVNASNILNKEFKKFNPVFEPNTLRNYYVYSGYRYRKSKSTDFEIEPSVFFQYFESDGRSITDINTKFKWFDFLDYYYAGFTYRFLNDQLGSPLYIAPIVGLKKGDFYFGYSYQVIMNEILGYSTGTHVITLGIDLFQGISNCTCTY